MGDVVAFRRPTTIRLWADYTAMWSVEVSPCPPGVPAVTVFWVEHQAVTYADVLSNKHGWPIAPTVSTGSPIAKARQG